VRLLLADGGEAGLELPFGLVGDLAAIKEQLRGIRERYGLNRFTVSEGLGWQLAPLVAELCR
jgi:hypothetical protein